MLTNWYNEFDKALQEFTTALFQPNLSIEDRESAAVAFSHSIELFDEGGTKALEVLFDKSSDKDSVKRNAAIRILSELSGSEAISYIVGVLTSDSRPDFLATTLRQIGKRGVLPHTLWEHISNPNKFRNWENVALTQALLRYESKEKLSIFEEITDRHHSNTALVRSALKAVSNWEQAPQLMWEVINADPSIQGHRPDWLSADLRLDAAMYIALSGDLEAVRYLDAAAREKDYRAAQASLYLAWLGIPNAIGYIEQLIGTHNSTIVALAVDSMSALCSPKLGLRLLEFAIEYPYLEFQSILLSDNILMALRGLTGKELPEANYVEDSFPIALTDKSRQSAISFFREQILSLDEKRRYYKGELLSLEHLASKLLSHHTGVVRCGVYNLRAITGNNFGFDPDGDLISNIHSIISWRDAISVYETFSSGEWYFHGTEISDW